VRLTLWPRSAVLAPVVHLSAKVTLGALVRAIEALDDGLASGGVTPALPPRHPAQREPLERASQQLLDLGGGGRSASGSPTSWRRRPTSG
jgi:hypothetical protein